MSQQKNEEESFLMTTADFKALYRQAKGRIRFAALSCSLLLGSYAATRPIKYEAEATFKEKNNSQAGLGGNPIAAVLFSATGGGGNTEAITLMTSKLLLSNVASQLSLQATLTKKGRAFPTLKTIRDNLKVEYGLFLNKKIPILPDIHPAVAVNEINYKGEIPKHFMIYFSSSDSYKVYGPKNKLLGYGKIDAPFVGDNYSFTLKKDPSSYVRYQEYNLTLEPLQTVAKRLSKTIAIKGSKEDKSVLDLTYLDRDRHRAAELINKLMFSYKEHLKEEHKRIAEKQIGYLYEREEAMGDMLKGKLDEYAHKMTQQVTHGGFPDTEMAMKFLGTLQQKHKDKILNLDLLIKHQQGANEHNFKSYETQAASDNDPQVVKEVLTEIHNLKQYSDSIELTLGHTSELSIEEQEENFVIQVDDLRKTRESLEEATQLLTNLNNDSIPPPALTLFTNSNFMAQTWYERLAEAERNWKYGPEEVKLQKKEEWCLCKKNFQKYMDNLVHFLKVQETTIEEKLAHQQSTKTDFQGINIKTADELFLSNSKELIDIQANILQNTYIIEQMKQPEFEISSLSTVLSDPVSREMIQKAAKISLELKEEKMRSEKELTRMKEELTIQKGFLAQHLLQTIELNKQKENLIKNKIESLQRTTLALIQQRLSILDKHLKDYLKSHLVNLKGDRTLIAEHQEEVLKEMATIPERWVAEKQLDQYIKMNQGMVEEVTKLVESKNITSNLEMIQSSPIDIAIPPLNPKSPRILFYATLGALLGAFLAYSATLARSVLSGVTANGENLTTAGMHVSGGIFTPNEENTENLHDLDLSTFRRALTYLNSKEPQAILLFEGTCPNTAKHLANLLHKKGKRVFCLPLTLTEEGSGGDKGLIQYLEGTTERVEKLHEKSYDTFPVGGFTRFYQELIHSKRFLKLLVELHENYDVIIGVAKCSVTSAEAEGLLTHFKVVAVTLNEEKLHHLEGYRQRKDSHRITFLLT